MQQRDAPRASDGSGGAGARRVGPAATGSLEGGSGRADSLAAMASSFCSGAGNVVCDSLDCGVYFERRKLAHELDTMSGLAHDSCDILGW